jgi:hypothetical protein
MQRDGGGVKGDDLGTGNEGGGGSGLGGFVCFFGGVPALWLWLEVM